MSGCAPQHLRDHLTTRPGRVQIQAAFSARPTQRFCEAGYIVGRRRADGLPLRVHKMQALIHQISDAVLGWHSSVGSLMSETMDQVVRQQLAVIAPAAASGASSWSAS
jgi:hypothetical protein